MCVLYAKNRGPTPAQATRVLKIIPNLNMAEL